MIIQNGSGAFQGPIIYYLDNFVFTKSATEITLLADTRPISTPAEAPMPAIPPRVTNGRTSFMFLRGPEQPVVVAEQPEALTYAVTWADFPTRTPTPASKVTPSRRLIPRPPGQIQRCQRGHARIPVRQYAGSRWNRWHP
jgi:hypothetical protein